MKNNVLFFVLVALTLTLPLMGCKKIEGPGGAATIEGKLYIEEYDAGGNLIKEYPGAGRDVYIIYGNDPDETYFHDDIETSYDGSFKFRFLEPGNYRIFYYEDKTFAELQSDPSSANDKVVIHDVEITDKREVKDLGTFVLFERF